jgi:transcriptional regulator with XRE-family HTH domain
MTENFGTEIRQFREQNGIKQDDLARRLGVSQSSVSMWETGTVSPNPRMMARIRLFMGNTTHRSWITSMVQFIVASPLCCMFVEARGTILARSSDFLKLKWSASEESAFITKAYSVEDGAAIDGFRSFELHKSSMHLTGRFYPFHDCQTEYAIIECLSAVQKII